MLMDFLKSQMFRDILMGWLRHGVTVLVPTLIAAGLLQQNQANDLLGSVLFLAGIGWSAWQKYGQTKTVSAATGTALLSK